MGWKFVSNTRSSRRDEREVRACVNLFGLLESLVMPAAEGRWVREFVTHNYLGTTENRGFRDVKSWCENPKRQTNEYKQ